MITEWNIGDLVTLRNVHPCGSYKWNIYRVGADIGIRCATCGRRILMERRTLEKHTKQIEPTSDKIR